MSDEIRQFPWTALFAAVGVLSTVALALITQRLRDVFATREDLRYEREAREAAHQRLGERMGDLEKGRAENATRASEAFRMAELTQRTQTEQAQRLTEEVFRPLREMAKDMASMRETFARYVTTTETLSRAMERLEKRIDRAEERRGE